MEWSALSSTVRLSLISYASFQLRMIGKSKAKLWADSLVFVHACKARLNRPWAHWRPHLKLLN